MEYSRNFPIEEFDFIITDECHRSIYDLWRQVLEYFDAFLIGLTATPSRQTMGFFNQNLVMEYGHPQAVADGVNVPYNVYRIETKITEEGSTIEAGMRVDRRDRRTRTPRWAGVHGRWNHLRDVAGRTVGQRRYLAQVVWLNREKEHKPGASPSDVPDSKPRTAFLLCETPRAGSQLCPESADCRRISVEECV